MYLEFHGITLDGVHLAAFYVDVFLKDTFRIAQGLTSFSGIISILPDGLNMMFFET